MRDDIFNKLYLKTVDGVQRIEAAREQLSNRTSLSKHRKSGIITIFVVDGSPRRAAAIGGEYVKELSSVVTELNTSPAHRKRVFLERRLTQVKQDLECVEKSLSELASKSGALDIPTEGKARLPGLAVAVILQPMLRTLCRIV